MELYQIYALDTKCSLREIYTQERGIPPGISLVYLLLLHKPRGVLYIFWVRGRAIGKGIDFHDFGIRNGIDLSIFAVFTILYRVGYAFSENWYKVGYIFLKNWYKVGYTFWKNWYKERVCF